MATDPNKTVFISYRRSVSRDRAVLIFNHLRQQGYDVFLDVKTIDSGAFDSVILNQIGARTHFVVLIADGALQRCQNEGDWLRREIEEALRLGRNIIPVIDEGVNFDQEMGYLPSAWRDQFKRINSLPWVHYYFDSALLDLVERFLKPPAFPVKINPVSADEERLVQQRILEILQISLQKQVASPKPKVIKPYTTLLEIMPQPFRWVDIPKGKVTILAGGYLKKDSVFNVEAFQIARYPITNAQFDVFIKHSDGYQNKTWWNFSQQAELWYKSNYQPSEEFKTISDYLFDNDEVWGNEDYFLPKLKHIEARSRRPRTNISWYEAVAFCNWLSAITGEKIALPSEQQWQRASQGDSKSNVYPFHIGHSFPHLFCNISGVMLGEPTPVDEFEGKGDSVYGVSDMSGNVWEWCSTSYDSGEINLKGIENRIVRGGSWKSDKDKVTVFYREAINPIIKASDIGFRIIRTR